LGEENRKKLGGTLEKHEKALLKKRGRRFVVQTKAWRSRPLILEKGITLKKGKGS